MNGEQGQNGGQVSITWKRGVIGLLLFKLVLLWVGFDRAPMASNNDEVLMADQAATLAAGGGLRAASFEGLAIGEMYAHHPPIYSWLMAAVFRGAGVNVFTVRGPALLAYSVFHVLFFAVLARLEMLGWLSSRARWLALLLQAIEPTGFVYARFGRIDPFVLLFATWSFLLLLPTQPGSTGAGRGRLAASVLLMGLALSCYIGAAIPAVGWGIAVLLLERKTWPRAFAVALGPLAIFAALWCVAYGGRSWEGIEQMREISRDMVGYQIGVTWLREGLQAGNWRLVIQAGGTGLILGLLLTALIVAAATRIRVEGARKGRLFWAVSVPLLCWILMLAFIGGGRGRMVMILPVIFVSAAVVDGFAPHWYRRALTGVGMVAALVGAGSIVGYVGAIVRHWAERGPSRLDAIFAEVGRGARVAAMPQFWLGFRERGQPVRVIDFGFGPDRRYWRTHPEALQKYDIILLNKGHELLDEPGLAGWTKIEHQIPDYPLMMLRRK